MSWIASALAIGLVGLEGHVVQVETHIGQGLVGLGIVGLPDASLREAKDRVRAALQSCEIEMPERRTTVNLSPAGLPKAGSGFDLAIAVSLLAASGTLPRSAVEGRVHLGELGVDGSLRAVRGILPCVLAAREAGVERVVVPEACAEEARLVPDVHVTAYAHLADLVRAHGGQAARPQGGAPAVAARRRPAPERGLPSDLADVRGQPVARYALEVAAAGGHHLFLVGEPGAGKTMLAARLTSILPDLDDEQAITVTALHSVAGRLRPATGLIRRPPLQAPHHTASMPALVGGGSGIPRPGAASLAHAGVLVLDEAAEFPSRVLDSLRQPLETGSITIHRAGTVATYPARFQLVMASNPCPCGRGGARCTCTSTQRRRYLARLSGPLLDRIDMQVPMRAPTRADLVGDAPEASAAVRERVREAREREARRWRDTPWRTNAEVPGAHLRRSGAFESSLLTDLDRAVDRGQLTLRGVDRVLRLTWTIADLRGGERPDRGDLAHALALRTGDGNAAPRARERAGAERGDPAGVGRGR